MAMFRHVVMFRWSEDSTTTAQERAISGLRDFAEEIRALGTLSIGVDAGISEGNFDAVVVADFPDRETYLTYASDPRHTAMIANYLAPIIAARVAVQAELI
jgi:hypothetical protein